ncbi:Protocadherin Fat 4 [Echinococcus granulosus]|uniref:Protocadherin Fat 4 n=1 Tax=Echinococcus granulosus TaxID=6210 RepID=W6UXB9_ECHGR|nr:Protocadherin Fat 4 [Echinococcus granulosus]EUB58169.1 Protocadherin Fat 4 [Echinococcus granulosus]
MEVTKWTWIDREGRIFTTRSLDREQESVYELHVLATDRPVGIETPEERVYTSEALLLSTPYNTATATISVSIQDLNDNPPHFVHPTNTSIPIRVSFQEDVGFVLTRMVAIDPDNGKNGTVSYRIVRGNRHGVFKLGEYSGDLYIGKKMVPEQVRIFYVASGKFDIVTIQFFSEGLYSSCMQLCIGGPCCRALEGLEISNHGMKLERGLNDNS